MCESIANVCLWGKKCKGIIYTVKTRIMLRFLKSRVLKRDFRCLSKRSLRLEEKNKFFSVKGGTIERTYTCNRHARLNIIELQISWNETGDNIRAGFREFILWSVVVDQSSLRKLIYAYARSRWSAHAKLGIRSITTLAYEPVHSDD